MSSVDNFAFKQYLEPCLNPRWRVLDVCSYSLGQSHKLAKPDTFPGAVVSEATEPAKKKNGSLLLCFVIFTILFGG